LNKINKTPKVFFGWWMVAACGIVGFLGVGFGNMAFSILFKPISAELGLDRAVTSLAFGIQSAMGGIIGLTGGWASDRYGPRRIMLAGIIVLVMGCAAMFFVHALWSFLLAWGVLVGGGFSLGATFITDRAIINWFVKKSGIAISIKFAIQSLAGLLLLPVIALLVINQGWRNTCVIAGVVIAVVTIPLTWFFIKPNRPEFYGLTPDGAPASAQENQTSPKNNSIALDMPAADLTLHQTMKTSAYWIFTAMQLISAFAITMMGAHFVPFLTDRGISAVQAAGMMGLLVTVSIPARLIAGFTADRLTTSSLRFLMAAGIYIQAVGAIIFLAREGTATIYVWILLYSIGGGISQSGNFPLQARYFGRKAFGSILGLSTTLQMPVALVVPSLVGWVYDTRHSYLGVILAMAVLLCASGTMACFIRRPAAQVPVSI
jgi:sugar phosphate permease